MADDDEGRALLERKRSVDEFIKSREPYLSLSEAISWIACRMPVADMVAHERAAFEVYGTYDHRRLVDALETQQRPLPKTVRNWLAGLRNRWVTKGYSDEIVLAHANDQCAILDRLDEAAGTLYRICSDEDARFSLKGRRNNSASYERIPADYFLHQLIFDPQDDSLSLDPASERFLDDFRCVDEWTAIKVKRAELLAIWPPGEGIEPKLTDMLTRPKQLGEPGSSEGSNVGLVTQQNRRFARAVVRKWFEERVANWPKGKVPPTEAEDVTAAKNEVDNRVPRDFIRKLRRDIAPVYWRKPGPRKSRGKNLAAGSQD